MINPPRAASVSPLEADRMTPYLWFLFLLLSTATLFDGFDAGMLSFAAPESRRTLAIDLSEWGLVNSVIRLGVWASFLFLLFADRFGRRNLMMVTVVGFGLFSGLTAFVTDKYQFVVCQFLARLFLTAEYSLAVIMAGEEFPARLRGRSIAILTSLATVGVMLMAKGVQPFVLLDEGAPGNWLHDLGSSIVTTVQAFLGLRQDGESWRSLYALALFPLLLILVLRLAMRETRRFEAVKVGRREAALLVPASEGDGADAPKSVSGFRDILRQAAIPWQKKYRRRTAIVTLLWNSVYMVTGPSVVYYVIFARENLGLSTHTVGDIIFYGYFGGTAGHFVAAWLIERIGRKKTCAAFYVLAAISIAMLYQDTTLVGQYLWMMSTVFAFGAANTATHVYASELFPTEIRATGYAWTTNLTGRITEVLTPTLIGVLILWLGISNSILVVAIGPILGAILVMKYAPETMGLTLEEIQACFERDGDGADQSAGSRFEA
jgi:putative MFS transporter